MSPLAHGFLAGVLTGAFGMVCLILYLAQRWELTGSPSCLRCKRELEPEDGSRRTQDELEELHVAGCLVVEGLAHGEDARRIVDLVRAYETLDVLAIDRMRRGGGTKERDLFFLDRAMERMRAKLESVEGEDGLFSAAAPFR